LVLFFRYKTPLLYFFLESVSRDLIITRGKREVLLLPFFCLVTQFAVLQNELPPNSCRFAWSSFSFFSSPRRKGNTLSSQYLVAQTVDLFPQGCRGFARIPPSLADVSCKYPHRRAGLKRKRVFICVSPMRSFRDPGRFFFVFLMRIFLVRPLQLAHFPRMKLCFRDLVAISYPFYDAFLLRSTQTDHCFSSDCLNDAPGDFSPASKVLDEYGPSLTFCDRLNCA